MATKVLNLSTSEEIIYLLPPKEAVVCAFMQYAKKNFNTWDYDFSIAKVSKSGVTVYCGDFAALINPT